MPDTFLISLFRSAFAQSPSESLILHRFYCSSVSRHQLFQFSGCLPVPECSHFLYSATMAVRTQIATVGNRGRHSSNPSDPFNLGRPGGSIMDPTAPNPFATPDFVTPAPSAPSQSSRSSGYFPKGKPPTRLFHALVQFLTLPMQYRHLVGASRVRVLLGSMGTRLIEHDSH